MPSQSILLKNSLGSPLARSPSRGIYLEAKVAPVRYIFQILLFKKVIFFANLVLYFRKALQRC